MTPAKPAKKNAPKAQKRVVASPSAAVKAAKPKAARAAAGAKKAKSRAGQTALMKPEAIEEMFRRFAATNPEPQGELEHVNAFTLLVAVVLSAQATDAGVNKATRALFEVADTPQKMVMLGEEAVREHIKTIGLFRNKAKNVVLLSNALIHNHDGQVPRDREALEALPGVGRKTANVVLNMAFGEPTIAVDTHLFRLAHRLALAPGRNPLEVEEKLLKVVPEQHLLHAHHWLILHGRYVCKAQRPRCGHCLVADLCSSGDKVLP